MADRVGTGKLLKRVPGGFASELVPCFACLGDGVDRDQKDDR